MTGFAVNERRNVSHATALLRPCDVRRLRQKKRRPKLLELLSLSLIFAATLLFSDERTDERERGFADDFSLSDIRVDDGDFFFLCGF